MMLAAWELGIGSVPATVYEHDLARRLLGYPDDQHCEYLLSFGYPADPTTSPGHQGRRPACRSTRSSTRSAGRRPRRRRSRGRYCQRNLRDAIPKQTTSQPSSTAAQTHSGANGVPPTMTWRSASAR